MTTLLVVAAALFPVRGEVVSVGKYQAKIVPEQFATLTFMNKGQVSDLYRTEDGRVEKGTVVAVMDKDKTE